MSENVGKRFDHYQIEALLGAGSMGEIYEARDLKLGRRVAIKILPERYFSESNLRRFEHEARSISALNHPNIVTIHDVGTVGNRPYIVMELVKGKSVRQIMDTSELSVERIVGLAAQAADGLAQAHEAGIVHRDLKPQNLMVSEEGFVKIVDFGLAKLHPEPKLMSGSIPTDVATEPGTLLGTIIYMSPEQARGLAVDYRSDQFSLGLIVYEMLSGHHPFMKETAAQTMTSIMEDTPQALTRLNPEVPAELESIIRACLAKSPEGRFDSTRELAEALKAARNRLTVSTIRGRKLGFRMTVRRRWITAAVLTVVALAGAVAFLNRGVVFAPPGPGAEITVDREDWVLVAGFDNQTGEPIFDNSLDTAFRIGIEQSQLVRQLPRSRVTGALQHMRRDPTQRVSENLAREIAEREGAKLVIAPSIAGVGGSYVLTARIQHPATGASLRSEMVRASDASEVLESLDALIRKTRQAVGETAPAIEETSRPLAQATTASLEALKEYSLGRDKYTRWELDEAKLHFENALHIDPEFTAARAMLGMLLFEQFGPEEQERGRALIEQASRELTGLNEKERLGILAFKARAVDGDLEKAMEYYRARTSSFPGDVAGHHTLGWFYYQLERFEEAAASLRRAIAVDPYFMMSYNLLGWIYLYQWGDAASGLELARRQIELNDGDMEAYSNLGWAYLGYEDWDRAEEAFLRALSVNPDFALYRFRLAHVQRITGDITEAIETLKYLFERPAAEPGGSIEQTVGDAHYQSGLLYRLLGEEDRAREHFLRYREHVQERLDEAPGEAAHHIELALVEARLGDEAASERSEQRARELDDGLHFDYARLLAVRHRPAAALDRLEQAVEAGFSNFIWMKIHPDLASLTDEPRFRELLERSLKL